MKHQNESQLDAAVAMIDVAYSKYPNGQVWLCLPPAQWNEVLAELQMNCATNNTLVRCEYGVKREHFLLRECRVYKGQTADKPTYGKVE